MVKNFYEHVWGLLLRPKSQNIKYGHLRFISDFKSRLDADSFHCSDATQVSRIALQSPQRGQNVPIHKNIIFGSSTLPNSI